MLEEDQKTSSGQLAQYGSASSLLVFLLQEVQLYVFWAPSISWLAGGHRQVVRNGPVAILHSLLLSVQHWVVGSWPWVWGVIASDL